MEFKIKNRVIHFTYKMGKNETYTLNQTKTIKSLSIYPKPQTASGYTNINELGRSILLADYDRVDISVVEEDYKGIQSKFHLPQSYLFKTDKGYHLVCLKSFPHGKIFEILSYLRIDSNYRTMPLRSVYRSYVLRISQKKNGEKIKFLKMVGENKNLNQPISKAHYLLLRRLFPKIKHPLYTHLDSSKVIKHQIYETK